MPALYLSVVPMVGNDDWWEKTLKRMYPGVRGRLVDLCKPTQRKYNVAVTTAAGTVSCFLHMRYIVQNMFCRCLITTNLRLQKLLQIYIYSSYMYLCIDLRLFFLILAYVVQSFRLDVRHGFWVRKAWEIRESFSYFFSFRVSSVGACHVERLFGLGDG